MHFLYLWRILCSLSNLRFNKLRLVEYFSDRQSTESIDIVKPESTFHPPTRRDQVLDTYIDYLTKYPLEELLDKQGKVNDNGIKEQSKFGNQRK